MSLILLQPGDPGVVGLGGVEGASDSPWNKLSDEHSGEPLPFDGKHCIELVSIGHGMKQQVTTDVSNSARTSGRPVITDIACVGYLDRSSVRLNDLCLRAKPLGVGAEQPTPSRSRMRSCPVSFCPISSRSSRTGRSNTT